MNIVREIRERRVLPAVGVYVGASWVVVEIFDRLTERYFLSPYLTDIVFWGLYSLIPAVILVAWTHGRPGKDKSTRAEKVGVPINIIATVGLLMTIFAGKDLGATAEMVTVDNELGQQEAHFIPRDSFRRRAAIFFWDNESGDENLEWLQYSVTELLAQDLRQNPFMLVSSPWDNMNYGFYNKMKQAGFENGLDLPLNLKREVANTANRVYFVDGNIDHVNEEFRVSARVWKTETLELLGETSARGTGLLALVDQVSEEIRGILDIPPGKGGLAGDLPLEETYGESETALRHYIEGLNSILFQNDWAESNRHFDAAIEADPDFVMGWYMKGLSLWEQGDVAGSEDALAAARNLDYRLPERDRVRLKAISYRIAGEQDKLEKFLRLQIQLRRDAASNRSLARFLMFTGRLEEAKQHFKTAMELDSSDLRSYVHLADLERATGDLDAAVRYARLYLEAKPDDLDGYLLLGDLLLKTGDLNAAEERYEQAQLVEEPPLASTLRLALLAMRRAEWATARELIGEARAMASTPMQHSNVLAVEGWLEVRLGRIGRAIELAGERLEFNRQVMSPLQQIFNYDVALIEYNISLGQLETAEQMLQQTHDALQPPMNQFLSFSEALLHARKQEIEAAEAALSVGVEAINRFKADYLSFQIPLLNAEIALAHGDYSEAARHYQDAISGAGRSVLGSDRSIAGNLFAHQMAGLYGAGALAHARAGEVEQAQSLLDHAFQRDGAEPRLWMARALLQQADGSPRMALASINYALAVWAEADPSYVDYREALEIRDALAGGRE